MCANAGGRRTAAAGQEAARSWRNVAFRPSPHFEKVCDVAARGQRVVKLVGGVVLAPLGRVAQRLVRLLHVSVRVLLEGAGRFRRVATRQSSRLRRRLVQRQAPPRHALPRRPLPRLQPPPPASRPRTGTQAHTPPSSRLDGLECVLDALLLLWVVHADELLVGVGLEARLAVRWLGVVVGLGPGETGAPSAAPAHTRAAVTKQPPNNRACLALHARTQLELRLRRGPALVLQS